MMGPECVAQQKKLVSANTMNCGDRINCPMGIAGSRLAASPPCVEARSRAGGRRTKSDTGTSTDTTSTATICSTCRQSCTLASRATHGDIVRGATPNPTDTSDTARLRCVENQPVTQAMIGAKIAEVARPTNNPNANWNPISDGAMLARWTCLIGSLLLGGGLELASMAPSLIGFQFAFGLLVGLATSAIFAPIMACVTGWFSTQRSLAVSLVSAGFGVAPLTMSPWVARLASEHDWRQVLQIVAMLVVSVLVPVSLLARRPPALEYASAQGRDAASQEPAMPVGQLIRSPQFIVLVLTNFFCCATHSGPIIHTVSYAVTCGIPLTTAVTIYSVEGLAGLGGRIAFGLAGDRFGARRTLITGLLMQAFFAASYYFASSLNVFYAVAVA